MKKSFFRTSFLGIFSSLGIFMGAHLAEACPHETLKKIPVHVVVVTTFEIGHDAGDVAGEFQRWVEKLPLTETFPAPGTEHELLRYNSSLHVLGMVSGEGPTHMASAITALVLDPRFDLSHAYFILAGIAGIDPRAGTIGSAAWAHYVLNGGAAHLIDSREIPASWSDGFTPLQGATPNDHPHPPLHSITGDVLFELNPSLVQWAYKRTKNIPLPASKELDKVRAQYRDFPQAQKQASVMMGDTISAEIFWVGGRLNDWAERWMQYWTDGKGRFVTTAEEDIGLCQALMLQAKAGRVDPHRLLVLRTASNFDMPPLGKSPADMLQAEAHEEGFAGFNASIDAAYDVASPIVKELATHWEIYKDHIPQ